jgi:hypothetical protein
MKDVNSTASWRIRWEVARINTRKESATNIKVCCSNATQDSDCKAGSIRLVESRAPLALCVPHANRQ